MQFVMANRVSEAAKKIAVADHVLTQTYPLANEPRLLVTVCKNLDDAGQMLVDDGVTLTPAQRESIEAVHAIVTLHKDSAVSFKRRQNYVICRDDYRVSLVSKESVGRHLRMIRSILDGRNTA